MAHGTYPNDIGTVSKKILELGILKQGTRPLEDDRPKKYVKNVTVIVNNPLGGKVNFVYVLTGPEKNIMRNFTKLIELPFEDEKKYDDADESDEEEDEKEKPGERYLYRVGAIHKSFQFLTAEGTVKFISEAEQNKYENDKKSNSQAINQAEVFFHLQTAFEVNNLIKKKPDYDVLQFGKVLMFFYLQYLCYPPEELYVLAIETCVKETSELYTQIEKAIDKQAFKDWIQKNKKTIEDKARRIGIENAKFNPEEFEWKYNNGYLNRLLENLKAFTIGTEDQTPASSSDSRASGDRRLDNKSPFTLM